MARSDTGVWIDDATGELVTSPPKSGTQIVAKGGEVSAAAKSRLAAAGLDPSGLSGFDDVEPAQVVTVPDEDTSDDGKAEAGDDKPAKAKAAKKK